MNHKLKRLALLVGLLSAGGATGVALANDEPPKGGPAPAENRQLAPQPTGIASKALDGANPFTGKSLTAEESRRAADLVRAENQLLEERIRQINLVKDLESAPTKKKIELEKLIEQNAPRTLPSPNLTQPPVAERPETPPKVAPRVKLEPKKPVALPPPAPVAPPPPPPPPPPELRGTIKTKDGVSAIIENAGRTIIARPGEKTSLGRVEAISENAASIGESELRLRAGRVSRQLLTDDSEPVVAPGAAAVMPPGIPSAAPRPAPTSIPAPPISR